ncbi:MAG TPA: pantoate--beta-alanine ligase [Candidatus Limnocylindria bacterium]|nr:pantoate--beta-alanine ligase [Candidatus Limnocylindria bacterium]
MRTVAELHEALAELRAAGSSVGLVPTMGAFHDGHLALMRAARHRGDAAVVSLFVNPAQFAPDEDFARYPRDEGRDAELALAADVAVLFVPDEEEVYPRGFDTSVDPGQLGAVLEGAVRPGHFRGVATVCVRLFGLVKPDRAYFGRKDAQQVAVVKQVVRDLSLDVEIVACPTVRDADGLALSSRNAYLSASERGAALALPRALEAGLHVHRAAGMPDEIVAATRQLLDTEPRLSVDYVALADLDGPTLAAAVRIGSTRLIDNVLLNADEGLALSPAGTMAP